MNGMDDLFIYVLHLRIFIYLCTCMYINVYVYHCSRCDILGTI